MEKSINSQNKPSRAKRIVAVLALSGAGLGAGVALTARAGENAPCDPNMDVCIPGGTDENGNETGVTFPEKVESTTSTSTTEPETSTSEVTTTSTSTTVPETSTSEVTTTSSSTTIPASTEVTTTTIAPTTTTEAPATTTTTTTPPTVPAVPTTPGKTE